VYRTPNLSLPFKVLDTYFKDKNGMVEMAGFEPVAMCFIVQKCVLNQPDRFSTSTEIHILTQCRSQVVVTMPHGNP
jgi:hypothetical protein